MLYFHDNNQLYKNHNILFIMINKFNIQYIFKILINYKMNY
jgi:hypothetical protein